MSPETAPASRDESLLSALSGWASRASVRRLEQLLIVSTGLAAALLLLRPALLWPIAAACCTVATLAAWGLLDHQVQNHPQRSLRWLEQACAALGVLFAIMTGIGVLFLVLGSGWSTVGG